MVRAVQFLMMAAVGCGLIWFQQNELKEQIPPATFMAMVIGVPWGLTWLAVKFFDWRAHRRARTALMPKHEKPRDFLRLR